MKMRFASIVLLHILSIAGVTANLCPAGSWSDSDDDVSRCLPCASGHYCPSETATGSGTVLKACPVGTYLPYTGASSIDECYKCPRGAYCDVTRLNTAKLCPSGTYQPDVGTTSFSTCLPCPLGTLQPQTGAYECFPCPEGYICTDAAQKPIPIGGSTSSNKVSSILTSRTTINILTPSTVTPISTAGKICFQRLKN